MTWRELDVTREASIHGLAEWLAGGLGGVDILVNNAGESTPRVQGADYVACHAAGRTRDESRRTLSDVQGPGASDASEAVRPHRQPLERVGTTRRDGGGNSCLSRVESRAQRAHPDLGGETAGPTSSSTRCARRGCARTWAAPMRFPRWSRERTRRSGLRPFPRWAHGRVLPGSQANSVVAGTTQCRPRCGADHGSEMEDDPAPPPTAPWQEPTQVSLLLGCAI